jgi:hypothetical protein
MKTVRYSISIRAPREAVWAAMLGPETYRAWTAPFCEGSYYEGSWSTGEKIRFLGPTGEGMTSVIAESRPPEFVSIKHLGVVKDGVEDTSSPAAAAWAPSFENYSFVDAGDATDLTVEVETPPAFEAFMDEAWPKALAKLQEICEGVASR